MTRTVTLLAVLALLNGCVSTSTGPEKVEPDEQAAAQQYLELGAQYYQNGKYELARDRLERAIKFEPKMAIAHSLLAMTYVQLENNRLATEHFNKAVRFEPDNFEVLNQYAVFLCQQKRYDEAQAHFDRAIKIYNNDNAEMMLTNAGVCMASKPDYELAEQYFRQALELRASYGEALMQLASLKFKTGNYLHARAFLQRYLVNNSPNPAALYLGVEVEKALGDDRASTDYTNQLLRDFPNSAEAKYIRGLQ